MKSIVENEDELFRERSHTWPSERNDFKSDHDCLKFENCYKELDCTIGLPSDINVQVSSTSQISSNQNVLKVNKGSLMTKTCGFNSYKELIATAIRSSYEQKLTLKQVYAWIEENVPHFRFLKGTELEKSWKNSVRHNLSLHKEFVRVIQQEQRASLWTHCEKYKTIKPLKKCDDQFRKRSNTTDEKHKKNEAARFKKEIPSISTFLGPATHPSILNCNSTSNEAYTTKSSAIYPLYPTTPFTTIDSGYRYEPTEYAVPYCFEYTVPYYSNEDKNLQLVE